MRKNHRLKNKPLLSITKAPEQEFYPVSLQQEGVYLQSVIDPDKTVWNTSHSWRYKGYLNLDAFKKAVRELILRQASLRTNFLLKGDKILQFIHEKDSISIDSYFQLVDLSSYPEEEKEIQAASIQEREAKKVYDLAESPLIRFTVVRLHESDHLVAVGKHHIIFDVTSRQILWRELIPLYNAYVSDRSPSLEPLAVQYHDYAVWQREFITSGYYKKQKEYWLSQLANEDKGPLPLLNLPTDFPRKEDRRDKPAIYQRLLDQELVAKLRTFSLRNRVSFSAAFLLAFYILLQRYSGQSDMVIGTLYRGRNIDKKILSRLIGLFANRLAMRLDMGGDDTIPLKELLRSLDKKIREVYENQDFLFEDLIRTIHPQRTTEHAPVSQVVFNMIKAPGTDMELDGLAREDWQGFELETNISSQYDLSIYIRDDLKNIYIGIFYSKNLFKEQTIQRISAQYNKILQDLVDRPGRQAADLEIVTEEEKRQLVYEFNDTRLSYPHEKTIDGLFAEQAGKTPDGVAAVGREDGGQRTDDRRQTTDEIVVTYRQLDKKSNRLAELLRERGVQPDTIVGIMMERSVEMIIGILGILKAGGAYLPIDPAYPQERIDYMLADSGANVLVAAVGNRLACSDNPDCQLLIVNDQLSMNVEAPIAPRNPQPATRNPLVYLIYTSGSTGKPKGVMIEHRAVHNFIKGMEETIDFSPGKTIAALTTISFDIHVLETLLPLARGLRVVIADETHQKDVGLLAELLIRHRVDMLQATPSRMQLLTGQSGSSSCLGQLHEIMVGGEAFPVKLLEDLHQVTSAKIYNMYGPTETTVWSAVKDLTAADELTIGQPIANTQVYILDRNDNLQPVGVAGELFIGGDGLARGYANNPALTSERFVFYHEGHEGTRRINMSYMSHLSYIYKVGDLARWLSTGDIEFLGRIDNQVKIRGFRIELGEIEAVLSEHGDIKEAVVAAVNDGAGAKSLCAYLVAAGEVQVSRLREYLTNKLPDYMVPTHYIKLDRLPLTGNNKIDRKALPAPDGLDTIRAEITYEPPRDEVEERLVSVWQEVLGIEPIGIEDNFFVIGGDSIKAIQIASRLGGYGYRLDIAVLFKYPIIKGLSKYVKKMPVPGEARQPLDLEPGELETIYACFAGGDKNIAAIYPLSPMQQGMLFHHLYEPDNRAYIVQINYLLEGEVDIDVFGKSCEKLVQRHDALRTVFVYKNLKRPRQVVLKAREAEFDFFDVARSPQKETDIRDITAADRNKGFDLSEDTLLRFTLIKTANRNYLLLFTFHHIIMDGWSINLVLRDFISFYREIRQERPLTWEEVYPYSSYIRWLVEQDSRSANDYWRNYLLGFDQVTKIQPLSPSGNVVDDGGTNPVEFNRQHFTVTIDKETRDRLLTLANRMELTLNNMLQGVWSVILHRYSGTDDILFGNVVSGRNVPVTGIEKIVGLFINTIPLRIRIEAGQPFDQMVKEIQENLMESQRYANLSLAELQEHTALEGQILEHLYVYENYPVNKEIRSPGLKDKIGFKILRKFDIEHTNYHLNIVVIPREELLIRFPYNGNVYRQPFIEKLAAHVERVIRQIVVKPDRLLADIEIVTNEEKRQLLYEFNDTSAGYPENKTIHELFAEQVDRTPDSIAVVGRGSREGHEDIIDISYMELDKKSNRLAGVLREKGVQSDTIVGIVMEKSVEMIIGILGILKAGGAYLPIDPDYPRERSDYMLKDSGAAVLVTADIYRSYMSYRSYKTKKQPAARSATTQPTTHLAYIIYTSGTTGKPKGVLITHRNVVRLMVNDRNLFDFSGGDVWTMFHSYCFDFSVWEMYGALLYGGKLIIIPGMAARDTKRFLEILNKEQVTVLNQTPSAFYHLLAEVSARSEAGFSKNLALRYIIFGGEALNPSKLKQWQNTHPGIKLINMYGITETTVHVTYKKIGEAETARSTSNIGRPIPTLTVYVMDRYQKLVPPGVPGELCVGGDGVGRGYLNRLELTVEKFILAHSLWLIADRKAKRTDAIIGELKGYPMSYQLSAISYIYRTGDLGRILANGDIEYLGRMDFQVKIRGFRIELGEIESLLNEHPLINESVVAAINDKSGSTGLCAYVKGDETLTVKQLKDYLAKELPGYMIPSYFVRVEKIPLTANGKVDRKSLPAPDQTMGTGVKYEKPSNEIEAKLVSGWQELLNVDKIGIHDNFFDCGGQSLKAIQLIAYIKRDFNVEIPLKELFSHPVLQDLGQIIAAGKYNRYKPVKKVEERPFYPVSPMQRRIYFIQQLEKESTAYNIYKAYLVKGNIDPARINTALQTLVARHDVFRTSFHLQDGEPVQRIVEAAVPPVAKKSAAKIKNDSAGIREMIKAFIRPFDLREAPLLRAKLLELAPGEHLLIMDMHHIITDFVSMEILVRDFFNAYKGEELAPLTVRYRDYAVWKQDELNIDTLKKQEEYWLNRFAGEIPVLNLPIDYPRPALQTDSGDRVIVEAGEALTAKINRVAARAGVTLYMVLLAAYNVLLSKFTGQEDIIVGAPVSNRPQLELGNIIGIFLNTLAFRNFPGRRRTFIDFLAEVKENVLSAFENQDYQFEDLVERLDIQRDLSRSPLFDTLFNLLNVERNYDEIIEVDGAAWQTCRLLESAVKYDIAITVSEMKNKLKIVCQYRTSLFKKSTIQYLVGEYLKLLTEITLDPGKQLKDYKIFDRQQLKIKGNAVKPAVSFERFGTVEMSQSIVQRFETQVEKHHDKPAVKINDDTLTYEALNREANRTARILLQKVKQTGNHDQHLPVALLFGHGTTMVVGILAVLKAGRCYFPLDPEHPGERLIFMLKDSGTGLMVTDKNNLPLAEGLRKKAGMTFDIIDVDDLPPDPQNEAVNPNLAIAPEQMAYILYTSGSTGLPKGVIQTHGNVMHFIGNYTNQLHITPGDKLTLFASYCFDGAVLDIFGALLNGATLSAYNLVSRSEGNLEKLYQWLKDEEITIYHSTPTLFRYFIDSLPAKEEFPDVRLVVLGGEAVFKPEVDSYRQYFPKDCIFVNNYGTTESNNVLQYFIDHSTEITRHSVPVGFPLEDIHIYVLDENNEETSIYETGEIFYRSAYLTPGYWNLPAETGKRLVKDPVTGSGRVYCSGDLGRLLPDGTIEYMGRNDSQVQMRGYRIELNEIETQLNGHKHIKRSVVTLVNDEEGEYNLAAYYVPRESIGKTLEREELRNYLKQRLPDYMVPAYFIPLDKIPLTPTGKVARKLLPAPGEGLAAGEEYVPPGNETEEQLVKLWQEILKVEKIGIKDNFFQLGGHSLRAMNLAAKIHQTFGIEFPLREIFNKPYIIDMAQWIRIEEEKKRKFEQILQEIEALGDNQILHH